MELALKKRMQGKKKASKVNAKDLIEQTAAKQKKKDTPVDNQEPRDTSTSDVKRLPHFYRVDYRARAEQVKTATYKQKRATEQGDETSSKEPDHRPGR